jgi:hypothetical protein
MRALRDTNTAKLSKDDVRVHEAHSGTVPQHGSSGQGLSHARCVIRALGMVDSSITKWMEVQKQWSNLYPIFMLSEDIKTQLPDDAKSFATCDELFRSMMEQARHYTNVIELCTTALHSHGSTGHNGANAQHNAGLPFILLLRNEAQDIPPILLLCLPLISSIS